MQPGADLALLQLAQEICKSGKFLGGKVRPPRGLREEGFHFGFKFRGASGVEGDAVGVLFQKAFQRLHLAVQPGPGQGRGQMVDNDRVVRRLAWVPSPGLLTMNG